MLALAPLGFIGSGGGSGDDSENHDPQATNNFLTSIYEDIYPPSETGNVITDDDGLGVDSDPDGDTLTVTAIRLGSETESGTSGTVDGISKLKGTYGYLIIAADGTYTYIIDNESLSTQSLAANEIVTEIFTYTISDGNGGTDSAMLEIDIHGKNDAPVAVDDLAITDEDTSVTIDVLVNDSDIDDGDLLTITGVTQGSHGTVTIDPATGNPVYTPEANWNGTDTFTYTISDGNGGTDTATVTVTVNVLNHAPDAVDDLAVTDEDIPITIDVLANDSDPDGDTLTVTDVTQGLHGTVTIDPVTGNPVYTPEANWNGTDAFTYTISDGNGGTDTSTLTITVNPVDDAFTDANEIVTTLEDTTKTGNVIDGISPDGPITITTFTVAGDATVYSAGATASMTEGTLQINGNGGYIFIPTANYNGAVPVATYTLTDGSGTDDTSTLTITVNPVDDDFTDNNEIVTILEDTTKTGNVIDGISSDGPITITTFTVAGDATVYSAGATASMTEGTLQINSDGSYTFIPTANYYGAVPVATYTLTDGSAPDDTSTLTITVTPVNDAFTDANEIVNVDEDTTLNGSVLTGTASVDGPVTVTQFVINGITYSAGDTASMTEGTLQINSDGSYTFIPTANYYGAVPVATYTMTDGLGGDISTLTITVNPVDDAFTDANEIVNVDEDTTLTGSVLTGTTSVDGPVTVTTFTVAGDATVYSAGATASMAEGTLQINSDGSYAFIPEVNYNGAVPVATYTLTDGSGTDDTSTLTITVNPVDDAITIIVADENSINAGGDDITVYEKALAIIGSDSALPIETTSGTFTVTAIDGLAKITVDTTDVTISQLENIGTTPITPISVTNGELTITGYDSDTGVVSYSYTLTSPDTTTPHANDGTNTTTQNISLSATDIDGDVATGVIKVGIVDDIPHAPTHNLTVDVPPVDTNLLLTIDLSYSMSQPSGVAGLTYLELQKIAILDMISQYDALGDIMVQIVTFSSTATVHGATWMTADQAKAIVLGLVVEDTTDYDAALAGAIDGFDNSGKIPDGQNISYFFSDGKPTEGDESIGIIGAEVTAWTDFLTANHIKSYAIGLGTGVEDTDLNPIAYNGIDNTEMDAIVVTDLSALIPTIAATIIPTPYYGDLSGNTSDIHNFGADGGYISNITFDGISYAYDGVGALTTTGSGYTFDAITHVLTQTTASGSTIELDMDDGTYYYTTPAIVVVAYDDHFDYSITDFDGDISTNTVDIHVNSTLPPADLIINGTSGADMLAGEKGNDIINGLGGNDVLYGDGGNDIITGGDGDDNLLGSDGDDILSGDAGDDYLYGDIGDDILISDLRTIDVAVAGDTNLGSVDGGAGFDTFRMSGDGTVINFDVWSGTDSVLKNIEVIDLGAGGTSDNHDLTNITYSDVVNMTDSDNDLYILGDTEDNVTFSGAGWSQSAGTVTEIVNGASHTFYTWTNSSDPTVMVKVESVI